GLSTWLWLSMYALPAASYTLQLCAGLCQGSKYPLFNKHLTLNKPSLHHILFLCLGQDHRGRFIINSVTGAVSTTRVLDREETSNYTLTIQAQDHGPTPLSSSTQIHVLLLDQNDNTPTFPHKTYQASISEGTIPRPQVNEKHCSILH
uniref:Cadherin domain-containing protein n=1 Tax=Periophthalmus magnuspinnatus TaxID=409849 RepID=A0A3B4A1Z6_9GOBI